MMEIEESVEEVEELNNKISESLCKATEEVIGQSKTRRRRSQSGGGMMSVVKQ